MEMFITNTFLSTKDWEAICQPVIEEHALADFLSVNAPDIVHENAFFRDAEGNPVEPVSVNFCEDGTITDQDGMPLKGIPYTLSNQKRLAIKDDPTDFFEIFQRELQSRGLIDKVFTHGLFKIELTKEINRLIELHKSRATYQRINIEVLALAVSFLEYLSQPSTAPPGRNEPDQAIRPAPATKQVRPISQPSTNEVSEKVDSNTHGFETAFINQLAQESMTPEKPASYPVYDDQRLQTDYKYRYDKVDELVAYMATIEPYTERVLYFMRVSQDMGLELSMFNRGGRKLAERKSEYNGNAFLDEAGNTVPYKIWSLPYRNDTEHIISKKQWFLAIRHELYPAFERWENIPLEQRKAEFMAATSIVNPAEKVHFHLAQIEDDIKELQEEYDIFQKGKTGEEAWEPDKIKRQRLKASALIERELVGVNAINWLAFHHSKYLQLFGILWDMVAFKLFLLSLSQPINDSTNNVPESTATDKDREATKDKQNNIRLFSDLLAGSFTKKELDNLLIHVRMKDQLTGKNIWPQKYKSAIWGIIDALDAKNHLIKTTRTEFGKSLGDYIGLGSTRVKDGHSTIQDVIKKKALSYLNQPVNSKK
ncbi:hypothetical protein J2I47_16745 [Fibrella sp. HMF5335]|uniref:Uncharacterized protein n=1 Tax=Fibrella rubiginis TaxID=2817060 RepID=A0A939GI31_9BACT|nr:hypothetical protein [Fibrella rubiginis]MBO0938203.1 hypothetical protein [Fibrella rubiginis]